MLCSENRGGHVLASTGETLLELLLAACLMTISLVPLFQLYRLSRPPERGSDLELEAALLARHVIERITALRHADPSYLPGMTSDEPIVAQPESFRVVSEHFRQLFGDENGINEFNHKILYKWLKPFNCRIDTYYLDGGLYKVIVYISFEEGGRQKRVFLERLLPAPLQSQQSEHADD